MLPLKKLYNSSSENKVKIHLLGVLISNVIVEESEQLCKEYNNIDSEIADYRKNYNDIRKKIEEILSVNGSEISDFIEKSNNCLKKLSKFYQANSIFNKKYLWIIFKSLMKQIQQKLIPGAKDGSLW